MKYPGRRGGGGLRAVHPALTKLLALDNNDLCSIDDPGIDQYQIDDKGGLPLCRKAMDIFDKGKVVVHTISVLFGVFSNITRAIPE